jgi:periplasmic copper chaperone A
MAGLTRKRRFVLAMVIGLLAACSSSSTSAPPIKVLDPRAPAPASPDVAAVYFTVRNQGGAADTLLSASTDVALQAQVHREVHHDAVMTMVPTGPLRIPAHRTVRLSVGGMHLMLIGLRGTLRVGNRFTLTLHFDHSGNVSVSVPVVPYASS